MLKVYTEMTKVVIKLLELITGDKKQKHNVHPKPYTYLHLLLSQENVQMKHDTSGEVTLDLH